MNDYSIDKNNSINLEINANDLHLLVISSLKHFMYHDDEIFISKFLGIVNNLFDNFNNETYIKMYDEINENISNNTICLDEWINLKDRLEIQIH